ncbi:AAA family ATPase [Kitasatospora sp. NPDC056327]|uniref:helix-turn-helix transcriptional regulator n=1 Tax=Kitasatospora sp. NPDC056327 TaxID=3345785 RepID=UPI0035DA35CF
MWLVERDSELSVLTRLLERCVGGTGSVAEVTGPVASGKTALLQALAERALGAGAVFLGATGSRAERDLPMGLVNQLLHSIDVPAEGVDQVQWIVDGTLAATLYEHEDRRLEPGLEGLEAGPALPPAALHGLCKVLFALAERGPVVIGIDDVQYADPASLRFLLYLARRLGSTRILVVFTLSHRLQPHRPVFQTEFLHHLSSVRVRLAPLSRRGVGELLAGQLGGRLDREAARRLAPDCHRISGGNPLLVRALAEDFRYSAADAPDGPVPGDAFGRAVATCLFRCDATTRRAAKALAVLGEHATVPVLAETLGLGGDAVVDVLAGLTVVGLLEDGAFRHGAVRAAVLQGMPSEERAALHARAAGALHALGAPAGTIGRHLVAAGAAGEEAWQLDTLCQAAAEALQSDDVTLAVSCLRMALSLCADPVRQDRIRSCLLRAEWRINPLTAARHLPALVSAAREQRLGCRDRVGLIGQLLWHGRLDQAAEVFHSIKGQRRPAEAALNPPQDAIGIALLASQSFPEMSDQLRPGALDIAPVDATVARHPQARAANALAAVLTAGAEVSAASPSSSASPSSALSPSSSSCSLSAGDSVAEAVGTAEEVLQGSRLDDTTLTAVVTALMALVFAGRADRAAHWCRVLSTGIGGRRAPTWQALLAAVQALVHVRRGQLAEAETAARTALTVVPARAWGVAVGVPIAAGLLAAVPAGRTEDAAAYLGTPVPEAMFGTPCGLLYLHARGRYHLATNRVHAALNDLNTCGELMRKWGIDLPALVAWRVEVADAHLRLGRVQEAAELLRDQLSRLGPGDRAVRGRTLRLLALTLPEPAGRLCPLNEAVELLADGVDRYERMLAVAELARTHRALGDETAARLQDWHAARLADQCGVPLPGEPCAEPSADPVPPHARVPLQRIDQAAPAGELSHAERRVAALAAEGHTNREIALKLYITVSTVEQHLTRAYRKLRVNRRSDLPLDLLPETATP